MAAIPSIEAHLIQLHKCLRLPAQARLKTEDRRKFSDLGLTLEKYQELAQHFMGEILASLDVGEEASTFVLGHFLDWANFYKAVQLHTWTGRASLKQVVWHLAANVHAPSLGRYLAYWAMDGALGQGMPGGRFWFLPTTGVAGRSVEEPIPKVLDWLLDLYGAPAARLGEVLGEGTAGDIDKADSFARNLSNWRKDPPYARTIHEMFPDDFDGNPEVSFQGTFEVDSSLPVLEQAVAAREFARAKGLNPDLLREEIPMTGPGRIESVLQGEAPPDEIERFVNLLRDRYSRPSARVIRRRLRLALMCQQAYRELCSFFGVKHDDSDLSRNKVLQLTAILMRSYNLTIEARKAAVGAGEKAEDRYFESRLHPWEALGQFMGVLPSRKGRAAPDVGARLTRIFLDLDPAEAELGDVIPCSPEQLESFARLTKTELEVELEEIDRYVSLKERVQRGSPWRALQGESWFNAVERLVSDSEVSDRVRSAAARRLSELAGTPGEAMRAILAELHVLLDAPADLRPHNVQSLVSNLRDEAKLNAAVVSWEAPLLAFEAKHLLAQNKWTEALAKFRAALDACSIGSFGLLRGEIARDAWSLALAIDRLQIDQEKFYRNMLDFGAIEGAAEATMEDVALQVAHYFWENLYKPYPGMPRRPPTAQAQAGTALKNALQHIMAGDWDELQSWLKKHRALQSTHLKDVRGDTVLTLWLKTWSNKGLAPEFRQHVQRGMEMLVEAWPAQANMADFKGQTPLMLAADAGMESVVVSLLKCPQVDVDAQDYLGRTAVHAAVIGGSNACVRTLLERQPDMLRVTYGEGQTVLHTAARLGRIEIAALVSEDFPFLANRKNVAGRTPAEECEESLQTYETYAEAFSAHGRMPPSRDALRSMSAMLTASCK